MATPMTQSKYPSIIIHLLSSPLTPGGSRMGSASRQQPSQTNHGVELTISPASGLSDEDDEARELLLDVGGLLAGGGAAGAAAAGGAAPCKIRVRGLCRRAAGGQEILRGVDLDVPRGAVVGVIGPSGSGKSTLLRALNRLWEPAPGAVLLDGADVCGLDVRALRRRVGMLFQQPAMFDGTCLLRPGHSFSLPIFNERRPSARAPGPYDRESSARDQSKSGFGRWSFPRETERISRESGLARKKKASSSREKKRQINDSCIV
jgi:hypothetical protein